MTKPTYCYSYDQEQFHGICDSREEALAEAGTDRTVYIGESVPYEASDFVNADEVIDNWRNRACDECGEWAEDWLDDVPKDRIDELHAFLVAWVESVDSPKFFRVPAESVTTHPPRS